MANSITPKQKILFFVNFILLLALDTSRNNMSEGEQMQRRLQAEVDGVMTALDREKLRPLQRNVYLKMVSFRYCIVILLVA